ncbi:MAG: hypothetical protein HN577_10740 [Rhodospirillaceae bacterium]|nr:hypothetical protein [Rhodospirillaceae bacterium]
MDASNALLVASRPVPVPARVLAYYGFPQGSGTEMVWADPDRDALFSAMQSAVDDWDDLAKLRDRARQDMISFRKEAIMEILADRLAAQRVD